MISPVQTCCMPPSSGIRRGNSKHAIPICCSDHAKEAECKLSRMQVPYYLWHICSISGLIDAINLPKYSGSGNLRTSLSQIHVFLDTPGQSQCMRVCKLGRPKHVSSFNQRSADSLRKGWPGIHCFQLPSYSASRYLDRQLQLFSIHFTPKTQQQ